ncbi:MAG: hypothetical protein SFV81_03050 [Pirellulaceae bacterium]|nr:hypothetical protein [Pirellulaceae bacterium]
MAATVEVFEIKRVVVNLLDGGAIERCNTYLELKNEDDATNDQNNVGTLTHAWNTELKENVPIVEPCKCSLQQANLRGPCSLLLMFERKAVLLRKRTENSVLIGHNEVADRVLIISDVNGSPLPAGNLEPSEALRDSVNHLLGPQEILNHHS